MTDQEQTSKKELYLNELVKKLKTHFSPEEIKTLLAEPEKVLSIIEQNTDQQATKLSDIKPELQNVPDQETNQKESLQKLIKNHLLAVDYHVFQWLEFHSSKNDLNGSFNTKNISDGSITRFNGNQPYNKIKEYLFNKLNVDQERRTFIQNYVSALQDFRHSSGEVALLGRIFIATAQVDSNKKGLVLIEGAFSTETINNRFRGRTNKDNQIVWVFDTQEAAQAFVNMFNTAVYENDPTNVENNTKIIEQSFKAMDLNPKLYARLEARLLLGQQVLKLN